MQLQPNCRHLLHCLQIKLLVENYAHAALLHAFDGKPTYALQGAQAGYFFSVPPSIVRSPQKQKVRPGWATCTSLAGTGFRPYVGKGSK